MPWFEKEMDYARDSLSAASDRAVDKAGDRLGTVMHEAVKSAGSELRAVVEDASAEIDAKLEKISDELHEQRSLTKEDVRELVDYAGDRFAAVLDARVQVMREEITGLVQEKVEYLKHEIDDFFIRRQRDLARERQRMVVNIALAFLASVAVGAVSLFYRGLDAGQIDMLALFRIVLASLAGGYGVYMAIGMARYWLNLAEHEKDMVYVAARYWGWLRPASLAGSFVLILALSGLSLALIFPERALSLLGLDAWLNAFMQALAVRPAPSAGAP